MARATTHATTRATRVAPPPPVLSSREPQDPPVKPRHAADPVFDQLAVAILEGSLAPGSSLPPERELSERFGVSRLIVRQAVHRLADIGLVRVKQGAPTQVVHPNDARDLRVIELVYMLGQGAARDVRELVERQFLHGYSLLFLAAKRASKERLRAIADLAEGFAARGAPGSEMMAFEKRFFTALAEATDNRFFILETSWWFKLTEGRAERPPVFTDLQRQEFYWEIARRLVDDRDAARFYLDSLSPLLDMLGAFVLMGGSNAR
jgi:GntR family transcriptional repressor for pyruvate dehydrogenase complex